MMQAVGRRYVRYFNDCHTRTGTLWEGRYRSALVDSQHYFFACTRYIELNPGRAGIVARPGDYRWSSFRCNAHGHADALVTPHTAYLALASCPRDRQAAYRAMFAGRQDVEAVEVIRRATNAGTTMGSARHRAELEAALQRRLTRVTHGGDRRSPSFRGSAGPDSTTLTP
jgi:putative transposase